MAVLDRIIRNHGLPLHGFTAEVLQDSVTSLNSSGNASATINTDIAVLRRWSEFQGLAPDSREIRKILRFKRFVPKYQLTDSDLLTPVDIETLIQHLRTPAWKCLLALLWDTGARIGEICKLEYKDITRDRHGFVVSIYKIFRNVSKWYTLGG